MFGAAERPGHWLPGRSHASRVPALTVARVADRLLERGPVGPAHRGGQEARARRRSSRPRRSRASRPGPGCPSSASSSVPAWSSAAHSESRHAARSPLPAEAGLEPLRDGPARAASAGPCRRSRTSRCRRPSPALLAALSRPIRLARSSSCGTEHRTHHRVGELAPCLVDDRGARVVDRAVEVDGRAGSIPACASPGSSSNIRWARALGAGPVSSTAPTPAERLRRPQVLRGGLVHRPDHATPASASRAESSRPPAGRCECTEP